MWYRLCQQLQEQNIQPLDPSKPRQNIPSGGALQIQLSGANSFNMGPQDPPKLIQVKTDSGEIRNVIILHGTPDNMLTFPGPSGQLQAGTIQQFDEWRKNKGWYNYPWIACHGGNIVGSQGSDVLINATGNVYMGERTDAKGNNVLDFTAQPFNEIVSSPTTSTPK